MTTVAVRLSPEVVEALDRLVDDGRFATRTEAIRSALDTLLRAYREAEIDRAIVEGYRAMPQTDEEVALATAATIALIEEEPW